jgi:hypothetical protein
MNIFHDLHFIGEQKSGWFPAFFGLSVIDRRFLTGFNPV